MSRRVDMSLEIQRSRALLAESDTVLMQPVAGHFIAPASLGLCPTPDQGNAFQFDHPQPQVREAA